MIRREFLRLLGVLTFAGLVKRKTKPMQDEYIIADAINASFRPHCQHPLYPNGINPFHSAVVRKHDGSLYPSKLECFCGHKITLALCSQDEDILGCSVCRRRVQLHILK